MAMFVHLTSAADAPRVRRSGIRAESRGPEGARGVFCFPVLPSFTLTHQWLRELARRGTRGGMVAVHVRLDDGQQVLAGHYAAGRKRPPHRPMTAAEAVRTIAAVEDPRGWEVFLPRAVRPAEVHRIRTAPQVVGWRYWPGSNGVRPCTCVGCRVRGEYGGSRLRRRNPHPLDGPPPPVPVLLDRIAAAGDPGDPAALSDALHWLGMRRRGPVPALAPLAAHPEARIREQLVWAIGRWSTPGVAALLDALADDPDPEVREAVESVREPL
ncbi:HEAT repeat domain-containing protein [Kitasatospora sp. NPDC057198]|uniref:HEAT repeat domain-containing protein n=1 Tax=Kitasatospora sp. NPDC057198 TaxID=3346046 RepID=UPI00363CB593